MAEATAKGDGPRVLVIGSGSAGLLAAHALQMQGARVTVYEQDTSLDARPRDWNFGIYWAQDPLAECLPEHLQKQVENAQVDGHRAGADEVMPIYNGGSGELLKAMPIPYNIRLARKKFLKLISAGIDIQYGKRLIHVSSDGKQATATFEDGTTETGDLLIGAEGAHSPVREFLVGPEKAAVTHLPLVASATMAKLPAEAVLKFQAYSRRLMVVFHPLGYFNWIGLHDAPENSNPAEWTFMMIMSWIPEDREYEVTNVQGDAILADLKRRAQDFSPDIRSLWESVPEGTKCWHNRLSYWLPEPWDNRNGTVTLVGDASHPMTFHRGQGLNNAIQDVALLARRVKEHGFSAEAINGYEREMIPRARDAVTSSTDNSLATHDWSKLIQSPLFTKGLSQK